MQLNPTTLHKSCLQCSAVFRIYPSQASKKFCSHPCSVAYRVANHVDNSENRFWAKVSKSDGCWLWQGANTGGSDPHGCFNSTTEKLAHRFSWVLHFGTIPQGLKILHKCDTPLCVRPDHLFLGTQKDNMQDCVSKGRKRNGIHRIRKLSDNDVREIRRRWNNGDHYLDIASDFGISGSHVWSIGTRKQKKHVPD